MNESYLYSCEEFLPRYHQAIPNSSLKPNNYDKISVANSLPANGNEPPFQETSRPFSIQQLGF